MADKIQFLKGLESNLKGPYIVGALYCCTDTGNTYLAVETEKIILFSTATQVKIVRWF